MEGMCVHALDSQGRHSFAIQGMDGFELENKILIRVALITAVYEYALFTMQRQEVIRAHHV